MTLPQFSLGALGYDEAHAQAFSAWATFPGVEPGRVVRTGRNPWVQTALGVVCVDLPARSDFGRSSRRGATPRSSVPAASRQRWSRHGRATSGRRESGPAGDLTYSAGSPVCGDWVAVEVHRDTGGASRAILRGILPRRVALFRGKPRARSHPQCLVANVDAVWIVCGLDRDQGIRSLERYQAILLGSSGPGRSELAPCVVLNKADACPRLQRYLTEAQNRAPNVRVVAVSALTGFALEQLRRHLRPGRTVALVGPSGVGKSSLINALSAGAALHTGSVRGGDQRGRHTTSASQLVTTPEGALLVDTPGLRELCLWQETANTAIAATFPEIARLSEECFFSNCSHDSEPGCAVKAALEEQRISPERFLRYLELTSER